MSDSTTTLPGLGPTPRRDKPAIAKAPTAKSAASTVAPARAAAANAAATRSATAPAVQGPHVADGSTTLSRSRTASEPSLVATVARTVGERLLPWLVPIILIVAWQLSSSLGWLSTRILPAPVDVVKAAWQLTVSGELWTHVKVSASRALLGLAIGGGLGLALGLLTGSVRFFETLLDSTVQMVRNIPALALIPLVILWFGIDETAKLFLIAVSVFFPIYLNTFHGIRSVDPQLIEMGRTYGLSRWQLYREVILPGALPSILVGLRFSLGLMWVILIVAETISAQAGIGYLTMNAREFLQTDVVLVGILLYALLGKLADVLARGLEQWWLRWHPGYQKAAR